MALDNCKGCGERVTDYDPDGFEGDDAQRGHYTCGQEPKVYTCGQVPFGFEDDDEDYRPAVEDMTEMGFHAG